MQERPRAAPVPGASAGVAVDSYAPYGQLVKMLLPSAGSIAIYSADDELLWCSEGYERPDLRGLLHELRAQGPDTLAGRGSVHRTIGGVPGFVAELTAEDQRPLGALVMELAAGQASRQSASMVASLLRPVLDCLESRMNLEHTVRAGEGSGDADGVELLLDADEGGSEGAAALEQLLAHVVQHLGCALGALLVPDRNVALSVGGGETDGPRILDRTQKHLLAWAQLNNRPMIVNRVGAASGASPYKILSCPVRDAHDRVIGLIALFRVVAAPDFELRDVRILDFVGRKASGILVSHFDALTGLVNRRVFESRLQRTLDTPAADSHALLHIDIDRLQSINEAFGFRAGDEVIQRCAAVVRGLLGPQDLAGRVGGDRLAVLLPHTSRADAERRAGELLATVAGLGYMNGEQTTTVSVSIGIAIVERGGEQASHALASAELACKRAKQAGRNRHEVFSDSADAPLPARRQMLAAASLQDALRGNDFRLEAQPIVGLKARRDEIVGYELLVRMRDASGAQLAPDKFLAAAERYHMLPALDRWVLCSLIETLAGAGWPPEGWPYTLTVNVSAQSVATAKFPEFALRQLADARLPPAAFCFEIAEAAAVNRLAEAERFIRTLTEAGAKVALDDFGCGLSSLAHLKRLPVDYLKVDGGFVRRLDDDRIAESIVSGIAKAARTLGVGVIAEHVETDATALKLRELDVDYGQGFFLGRPAPFADLLAADRERQHRKTGY